MSEKDRLRAEMKTRRAMLKSAASDEAIKENALAAFLRHESFFVYQSFGSEADTAGLIAALLAAGKKVCVPRIDGGEMRSVPLTDGQERGAFGILQPREGEEETCEVAFTPLLAADGDGHRLGYGGGYYDRYFASHEVLRVGLAYEGQVVRSVPHGETDLPLDALVTERGVRTFDVGERSTRNA